MDGQSLNCDTVRGRAGPGNDGAERRGYRDRAGSGAGCIELARREGAEWPLAHCNLAMFL